MTVKKMLTLCCSLAFLALGTNGDSSADPVSVVAGAYRAPPVLTVKTRDEMLADVGEVKKKWKMYNVEITKEDRESRGLDAVKQRKNDKFLKNVPKVRGRVNQS